MDRRLAMFGAALRVALAEEGLRQSDLAAALGLTQASVSAWVTGKTEPAATTVFKVEAVLNVRQGPYPGCSATFLSARSEGWSAGLRRQAVVATNASDWRTRCRSSLNSWGSVPTWSTTYAAGASSR